MKRRIVILFIGVGILLAIGLPLSNILDAASLINVTTERYNLGRNSVNTQETALKTSNVNVDNFGKLFSVPVVGDVYTQPLIVTGVTIGGHVHNVVYIATMHNMVYAFDADTAGPALWSVDLGDPFTVNLQTADIAGGEDGVLGTPVIDTSTKTMYLVSHHNNGGSPIHKIHALDFTTGAEKFGGPKTINATVGSVSYDAFSHLQRPGLALDNGNVLVAMGSTGDFGTWHGWLFAFSAGNLGAAPAVWLSTPNGIGGGMWAAGSAPTIDSNHYIYMMTGNGSFDVDTGGTNYGDSFVKLKLNSNNTFSVLDYFTPWNQAHLDGADLDLGTSGPVLIPGTSLLFGGGKTAVVYLVNSANMGKYICKTDPTICIDPNPDNNHDTNVLQEWNGKVSHLHNTPNVWTTPGNVPNAGQWVYVFAEQDYLKAYKLVSGKFAPILNNTVVPVSTANFKNNGMPSGVVTISANGSAAGTGIAWSTDYAGNFRAVDATNLTKILWTDSDYATRDKLSYPPSKFVPPIVANGKVYVPTRSNPPTAGGPASLDVYGLLPSPPTGGLIQGSLEHPVTETSVNLTAEGTLDWAHWGLINNTSFDHKSSGGNPVGLISNVTTQGTGPIQYGDNKEGYDWSDGTPTGSTTDTHTGFYELLGGSLNSASFQITVPADTTQRVLKVYVGMSKAQGTLTARLTDRSATTYTSSFQNLTGNDYGIYTITYAASSANQLLTVKWTMTSPGTGNITFQAATLALVTPPPQPTFQPPTNTPVVSATPPPTFTASPGPSPTPTATPLPNSFRVQYQAINVHNTETQIRAAFSIVNLTNNSANLSDFKIRYYFTKDGGGTLTFTCEFALVGCNIVTPNSSVQPSAPPVASADTYLELGFGSGTIGPNGLTSGGIQFHISKSDNSTFDQTNDYSFDSTMMTFTESRRVALFRNGVLIWGSDPSLGATTMVGPASGTRGLSSHPQLQWNPVSSASRYQVKINDAGGSTVFAQWYDSSAVCTGTPCTVTPNVTLPNNTYTWFIETGTPAQNGPWSAGWSFTVGP